MSGIKIPQAKIYPTFSVNNIKKTFHPRNVVSAMSSGGFLPVITLEACVEAGRTYQAYKRGGFDEARERITEEFSGAVFWLGGVTGLNWLFEKMGQKFLNMPKHVVDIAHDDARNPLNSYLEHETKTNAKHSKITKSFMSKYKLTKVISSVLIANAFIGFALPKINQHITKWYHTKGKEKPQNNNAPTANNTTANNNTNPASDKFVKKPEISDFVDNKASKNPSFGGKTDLLSIANLFENNRNCRLLSVDAGTASGRAISARNNDERVEILFRDLSSIYFYMFCMGNMNSALNRLEQGKGHTTRLNPASAKFVSDFINMNLGENKKIDVETFTKEFMGKNQELPQWTKDLFSKSGAIELDKFKEELAKHFSADELQELNNLADKMSELQPKMAFENTKEAIASGGKDFIDKSIITKNQAKDLLNGGHINNPEFLKQFFIDATGSNKFLNRYKYFAQSSLDGLKKDMETFVQSIIEKAKKTNSNEITSELVNKMSKQNFKMNAINWGSGFVVSALFLSTLIPKMQYLITKLRTGKDGFPGTEEYRK